MSYPIIILKPNRSNSVQRKHPWVFSGAIGKIILGEGQKEPAEGDIVELRDHKEKFLALGHFGEGTIAVRIISFTNEALDQQFWNQKFLEAFKLRKSLGLTANKETNCYRLIHAEGDHLPGLIVDIYNKTAIVQCHSLGMANASLFISEAIKNAYSKQIKAIYRKSESTLGKRYASDFEDKFLWSESGTESEEDLVLEYGMKFQINWVKGQKTGFFLDQRENRQILRKYCEGKKVLNTFCYSGGFSVAAMMAGASEVCSVDSSASAIELCNQNIALNFPGNKNHRAEVSDTLAYLNKSEESFDVIILDPPAYAKSKSASHNAIQGYRRLNERAIRMIKKGGILLSFSCSQVIHRKLFEDTITAAAIDAGRKVKILEYLSQPADHPVNIFHPEGAYLKGLILYVD